MTTDEPTRVREEKCKVEVGVRVETHMQCVLCDAACKLKTV